MFPTDILDDILANIEDEDVEASVMSGYGPQTWGIDWQHGRLFKASERETPAERIIKYIMTPRGQVEVYNAEADIEAFDKGYGSLVYTFLGGSFVDEEDAKGAFSSILDGLAFVLHPS